MNSLKGIHNGNTFHWLGGGALILTPLTSSPVSLLRFWIHQVHYYFTAKLARYIPSLGSHEVLLRTSYFTSLFSVLYVMFFFSNQTGLIFFLIILNTIHNAVISGACATEPFAHQSRGL